MIFGNFFISVLRLEAERRRGAFAQPLHRPNPRAGHCSPSGDHRPLRDAWHDDHVGGYVAAVLAEPCNGLFQA